MLQAFHLGLICYAALAATVSAAKRGANCAARPPSSNGCPVVTSTSTLEVCVTATTTVAATGACNASCTVTHSTSCPSQAPITPSPTTTTLTVTPSPSTVVAVTITPAPITTTITLTDLPTQTSIALPRRHETPCSGTSTWVVTTTTTKTESIKTVKATAACTSSNSCVTVSASSSCPPRSTVAPVTSTVTETAAASTTSITVTLPPVTVTATQIPTTTFNVLRATNVVPVDSDPDDVAIAASNDMYANLTLLTDGSGSYSLTFNVPPTDPASAAQFAIDEASNDLLGSVPNATDFFANTYYDDHSDNVYFSSEADGDGFTGLNCTVDANTTLYCTNGPPDKFKNQFTLCTGDSVDGENPNGNLYITFNATYEDCAPVTILFEQVVLYELIPPAMSSTTSSAASTSSPSTVATPTA